MRHHLSLMLTGLVLLGGASGLALAAEPASQPEPATTQSPSPDSAPLGAQAVDVAVSAVDKDDAVLVCKREKTIGSHMTTRICRTKAQIRYENEEARAALAKGINTGKALAGDQ